MGNFLNKKVKSILIIFILVLFSFQLCLADLVSISDRVGKKIDMKEREKYALFLNEPDYWYAVFLRLKDGTYTLSIIHTDGSTVTRVLRDIEYVTLQRYINEFDVNSNQVVMSSKTSADDGILFSLMFLITSSLVIAPSFFGEDPIN